MLPEKLRNKTWKTPQGPVLSEHLERMLCILPHGRERHEVFPECYDNSDRRVDRATQLLRQAALIEFAGGKWRVVVVNRAAL